jgi:glycosyltransferase involved in cell wall biosynthesis
MSKVLTIAVPAYNVEAFLAHGLSTCDVPELTDELEVIVVNDGSTDSTPAIAHSFAERAPEVFHVIDKPNGGHGSAVNAALSQATGTYFRVMDGDDWVDPSGLRELVGRLGDTDVDLVVDEKREVHMGTGDTRLFPLPDSVRPGVAYAFDDVCQDPDVAAFLMIHTLVPRTQMLRECGLSLLEHTFYEDYQYVVEATAPARSIEFLDVEVYQYQVGNASQSVAATSYVRRWDDHTRVVEEVLSFVERLCGERPLSPARAAYLDRKANLIIDTHYNIALLFDTDRARGARRAKEFRAFLARSYPARKAATDGRYRSACVLHALGVDAKGLDRLMGRKSREA